MAKLEICAASIESALNAQNAGADRIELCTELSVGGLTPSYGMIKVARDLINIPIYVLIRPRSGDFNYNRLEIEQMKEDIHFCATEQIDGVVFGALNEDRKVDEKTMIALMETAKYMDVTFHRAFDLVVNPFEALDTLIELGIQRVLTSGRDGNAIDHVELLGELIDEAGEELIVMPGGGIRPDHIEELLSIGAIEYHSSCLLPQSNSADINTIQNLKAALSSL